MVVRGVESSINNHLFEFRCVWMNDFLNDPNIPNGVRAYIHYYIGHERAQMKINGNHRYEASIEYEFLAQRWIEICR